jgi:hypothetical protein
MKTFAVSHEKQQNKTHFFCFRNDGESWCMDVDMNKGECESNVLLLFYHRTYSCSHKL